MRKLIQILKTIWCNLFGKKTNSSVETITYELVETEMDKEHFRQGIRILGGKYNRVIVTTSPKVQFKEDNGVMKLMFDYVIEYQPDELEVDHNELRQVVGDIILEIIYKDNNAPRTTDSQHLS